jgi:hypothetical protein
MVTGRGDRGREHGRGVSPPGERDNTGRTVERLDNERLEGRGRLTSRFDGCDRLIDTKGRPEHNFQPRQRVRTARNA